MTLGRSRTVSALTLAALVAFGFAWSRLRHAEARPREPHKETAAAHAVPARSPEANFSVSRHENPNTSAQTPSHPVDAHPRFQAERRHSPTPERDASLCALIEALAARQPRNALALALGEPDPALRARLLQSTLQGWATSDVDAAGRWALEQPHLPGDLALPAVFNGARAQPDAAIRFANTLSSEHPDRAQQFGSYLVFALGRADEHEKAAAFASAASAENARVWLTAAYADWGRHDPEAALASAVAMSDPAKRQTAFRASVAGWAKVDPQKLAERAAALPAGDERDFALVAALRAWAQKDPESAASYLTRVGPLPRAELILED